MNAKQLLDSIVANLRAIPVKLSGDDSPLADPWEEIKSQVHEELSYYWSAYVDTMQQFIERAIEGLAPAELRDLASELKVPAENRAQISSTLLKRLLARASKEKVSYEPFEDEYLRYTIDGLSVYSQIIERTGMSTCKLVAYSRAAPFGEAAEMDITRIDSVTDVHFLSAKEFNNARLLNWPDN